HPGLGWRSPRGNGAHYRQRPAGADRGVLGNRRRMMPAEALREKLAVAVFPDDLFGENCYLIRRRDTTSALVVDPGLQVERVLGRVRQDGLTVERILVTHGHIDHVGGVPQVHRETGAPIAMHPDDLAILDWERFGQMPFVPSGFTPFSIDTRLAHGTALSFQDMSLLVLRTTGHTQASLWLRFGPARLVAGR